jgi:hypothetical protein
MHCYLTSIPLWFDRLTMSGLRLFLYNNPLTPVSSTGQALSLPKGELIEGIRTEPATMNEYNPKCISIDRSASSCYTQVEI